MRFTSLFGFLFSFAAIAKSYEITLRNSDAIKFDVDGNTIDAHDGKIYHFEDKYILIGTAYDCGFKWLSFYSPTIYCGVKSYSSPDLIHWTLDGLLFDLDQVDGLCTGYNTVGCFRPKIVYNAATKTYVLWINVSGPLTPGHTTPLPYAVFTSSSPTSGYTLVGQPANITAGGDFALSVANNGSAYILYSEATTFFGSVSPGFTSTLRVQSLTADYTDVVDATVDLATSTDPNLASLEAPELIQQPSGTWLLFVSSLCGFCSFGRSYWASSQSPTGPFTDWKQFSNTSCGGQLDAVARIPSSDGKSSTLLYMSDLWTDARANQAQAGFHWQPLTFTKQGLETLDCASDATFKMDIDIGSNQGSSNEKNTSVVYSSASQHGWDIECLIPEREYVQTFQAASNGNLTSAGITIGQLGADSDLSITLFTFSNVTALTSYGYTWTTLGSATINSTSASWGLDRQTVTTNVAVTKGQNLGLFVVVYGGVNKWCYPLHHTDAKNQYLGYRTSSHPPATLKQVLNTEMKWFATIDIAA